MDSQKHISSAFDQDLTTLNDALQLLGEMAHRQFEAAINGLATQSDSDLDDIINGDAALDSLEAEIHEKAVEVIAIRSPRAKDLRYVLVALKVATILERIGDYATGIAEQVHFLVEGSLPDGDRPKADKTSKVAGT